jgi:hypothetical protein
LLAACFVRTLMELRDNWQAFFWLRLSLSSPVFVARRQTLHFFVWRDGPHTNRSFPAALFFSWIYKASSFKFHCQLRIFVPRENENACRSPQQTV